MPVWLLLNVLCASLLWLATPAPAFAQSVTERFGKAQRLFNQGQIKPAYKQLAAIARKYPDHQPTRLLLGRVFFRTGQVGRAASQFKRVSPDMLSGDAAYEYGLAFYQLKDYRRAKLGFARVPATSKFYDLASFYRGLSYYQTREYAKAQLYISRAKKLPKNLLHTRREALSSLRKLSRSERRGASQPTNPYVIVPTPPPPPVFAYPTQPLPEPAAGEPPPEAPAKPAAPPPPSSGFVNAVTPSFTWTQVAANIDYFGTKTESKETNTSALKVAFKSLYNAEPRDNGGQPYGSLGVDLSQEEVSKRGSTVEYKVYTDRPGEIIEDETVTSPTSTTSTIVVATPEFGYPASEAIDLKGGYKFKNADAKSAGTTVETGPYGSLDWGGETVTVKLTGSQTATDTSANKTVKTSTVMGGDFSKRFETTEFGLLAQQTDNTYQRAVPLAPGATAEADATILVITADATKTWESFSMTFAATQKTVELAFPEVYVLIGESQSMKLELSALKTFDFGGSLSVVAASEQLSDYQNMVDDPAGTTGEDGKLIQVPVKGNGSRTTITGTLKLTPIDWLFGSISLKQTTLAISVADPKTEPAFQKKTPEAVLEQTIQAGVSKSF